MIARFLARVPDLIVPPASLFPSGPHVEDGLEITFWEYCPHEETGPSPNVLGLSLRRLHDALRGYEESLPRWDRFDGVDRVLADTSTLKALATEDRTFLRREYEGLVSAISAFEYRLRPLHGEPHAANLLLSADGPRWIDFEAACLGPQEWDLTVLPDNAIVRYFADVNWDLLRHVRRLRSVCVATWCWLDPDRSPVLREAGMYHLALLQRKGVEYG